MNEYSISMRADGMEVAVFFGSNATEALKEYALSISDRKLFSELVAFGVDVSHCLEWGDYCSELNV